MNRKFGVPIFEFLDEAVETLVKFEFQPPRDLKEVVTAYLTFNCSGFGVLRYSFEEAWGFVGERFDAHKLSLSNKNFVVKKEDEKLDLTNLFRETELEKHPFIRCRFIRHGQNAYDTLNSRPEVGWFVLEYRSQLGEKGED